MTKDIKKTIRFSSEEYEIIEKQLNENGISFSSFVRKILLNKKIKYQVEIDQLYELNNIHTELEYIGKYIANHKSKEQKYLLTQLVEIENKLEDLL